MANTVSKPELPDETGQQLASQSSAGEPEALIELIGADRGSIAAEIERAKADLSRSGRKLRRARNTIRKERRRLFRLRAGVQPKATVVFQRSETALAQVVLAAQERSKRQAP